MQNCMMAANRMTVVPYSNKISRFIQRPWPYDQSSCTKTLKHQHANSSNYRCGTVRYERSYQSDMLGSRGDVIEERIWADIRRHSLQTTRCHISEYLNATPHTCPPFRSPQCKLLHLLNDRLSWTRDSSIILILPCVKTCTFTRSSQRHWAVFNTVSATWWGCLPPATVFENTNLYFHQN